MNRTFSANEKMITRFENEMISADGEQRTKLKEKISNLEQQNRQLRGSPAPKSITSSVKAFEDLTGQDWTGLSDAEKQRFIYTAIGGLERQGVFITRSPQEYIVALDKVLAVDVSLKLEYLDNLFVFCVYDGEPQTREAIRRIREEARSTQGV